MPRYALSAPPLRRHKATNQAYVTLHGRQHYLGRWGSADARTRYAALIAAWNPVAPPAPAAPPSTLLTVDELIAAFWQHALIYYRKKDEPTGKDERTGEVDRVKSAMRYLHRAAGELDADAFALDDLRRARGMMVADGLGRGTVNAYASVLRRCFRWGEENGKTRPGIWAALRCLSPLKPGRTDAPDRDPVPPVAVAAVLSTLPHLPPVATDLVRFLAVTGCRPGEGCIIRARDIGDDERLGRVYRPSRHKTEHHGHRRDVPLGEAAMHVLRPYLDAAPAPDAYLFRPASSGRGRYCPTSLNRAVARACDAAFPPPAPLARRDGESAAARDARLTASQRKALAEWRSAHRWHLNQLRHTKLTDVRARASLDAAQVVAGHATRRMTERYAALSADPLDVDAALGTGYERPPTARG